MSDCTCVCVCVCVLVWLEDGVSGFQASGCSIMPKATYSSVLWSWRLMHTRTPPHLSLSFSAHERMWVFIEEEECKSLVFTLLKKELWYFLCWAGEWTDMAFGYKSIIVMFLWHLKYLSAYMDFWCWYIVFLTITINFAFHLLLKAHLKLFDTT